MIAMVFLIMPFAFIVHSIASPVLSLVPLGGGKSQLDDQQRIIAAIVANNPYIGHLIVIRMANGCIEAINLTVWKYQADTQSKVS